MNVVLRTDTPVFPSTDIRFRAALARSVCEQYGFEHVWVKQQTTSLDVLLFMLADNAERAEVDAVTLCERALTDPYFAALRIQSCATRVPANEEWSP